MTFNIGLEELGREQSLLCRTHLLQAGADPTIGLVDVNEEIPCISAIELALIERGSGGYVTVISRKTSVS